jgi:hypothetical protein
MENTATPIHDKVGTNGALSILGIKDKLQMKSNIMTSLILIYMRVIVVRLMPSMCPVTKL